MIIRTLEAWRWRREYYSVYNVKETLYSSLCVSRNGDRGFTLNERMDECEWGGWENERVIAIVGAVYNALVSITTIAK